MKPQQYPTQIEFHVRKYLKLVRAYNAAAGTPKATALGRAYRFHFWTADLLHCQANGLLQGVRVAQEKLNTLAKEVA